MTLSSLGDSAVVVTLGTGIDESALGRVRGLVEAIEQARLPGVVDVVPAYATVTVFYDPVPVGEPEGGPHEAMGHRIEAIVQRVLAVGAAVAEKNTGMAERVVEIPVCYGGMHGPDLGEVAARTGIATEAAVALHSGADYRVHAVGFAPGFGYLGGLPGALHTPRRATPRARVPAGSVGIGGAQTGVYPLVSPGGWNVIGRTPLAMFAVGRAEPALLRVGDRVKFRAIGAEEFAAMETAAAATAPEDCHLLNDNERKASGGAGGGMGRSIGDQRMEVRVVRAGMLTTVQDLGRRGHRSAGVPLGGAMDAVALRVANLLVGNPEDTAGLEFTLVGPELEFSADTMIALGGAACEAGAAWRPRRVRAGERVKFGACAGGCRTYLAIAGGFEIAPVLGSRSTDLRGGFGGLAGRALRDGDVLPAAVSGRGIAGRWRIDERILPAYTATPTVRVVRGAQAEEFGDGLEDAEFNVTPQSDRMGLRLRGAALVREGGRELLSSAVVPGTIQVPPDGQPIVLMADAQTIGGYPQAAHVIGVDLPLVAQLRPGDTVRFSEVPLADAQRLLLAREHALALLRQGLAQKFRLG